MLFGDCVWFGVVVLICLVWVVLVFVCGWFDCVGYCYCVVAFGVVVCCCFDLVLGAY